MSKPWGIGAWAAEAEREEAEERERAATAAAAAVHPMEAFPPLGEAVSVKPKKKKQTFSLAELTIGTSVAPGSRSRHMSDSRGLTTNEMMMLPTGPRDRSGEEEHRGGLGGAFRDYSRTDREQGRGGYGGSVGFERDREGSGFLRDRERDDPSRADDSNDWSSSKKPVYTSGYDGEKRGSRLGDREPLPPSRADEVGNWSSVKKSLPLTGGDARSSGRKDTLDQYSRADEADNWASVKKPLPPRPVPHDVTNLQSRADEAGNWASSKKITPPETNQAPHVQDMGEDRWERRADVQGIRESQRKPLVIAPRGCQSSPPRQVGSAVDSAVTSDATVPKSKPNPFGSARPREHVLADRGPDLPRPKDEFVSREQDSRPSSSHSSRHDISETTREPIVQARPKVNPFGNAKPREVLLQERGKDWRKMDFEYEHRGVDRPETEEELLLKEEVKRLSEMCKKEKEAVGHPVNGVVLDQDVDSQNIIEELRIKERQLEELTRALDDKVRFSQKIGDRPGSRSGRSDAGRSYELPDRAGSRPGSRPGSRSGHSDVTRNHDPSDRPGSQSGRRNFESSESPRSLSGYGGRHMDARDRWSRPANFEGNRNQEGLERMGSWVGSSESGRSFESLQKPRRRAAVLPTEVGGAPEYPQGGGADIWTRANDRQGSWGEREHVKRRF